MALNSLKRWFVPAVSAFASVVFLDSLRFKFTDAVETQVIFGKLDAWAASFGAAGLFGHTGLFSQYVIGSAELVASSLLIAGLVPRLRRLTSVGAAIAFAVMSGAVSFHLFTPLGIDPNQDGGGLFAAAVVVWLASATVLFLRRGDLMSVLSGIGALLVPPHAAPASSPTGAALASR